MERDREEVIAGGLLGTFAGDAVGAGWEGAGSVDGRDATERVRSSLSRDELTYTDDTQLALALAEHLCDRPTVDPRRLAATFLEHHEGWRGYGGGMIRLIELWRGGTSVEEANTAVFPDGSFGNGAAMRVAPVGALWAHDVDRLVEVARRQARVTHAHPLGIASAVVQARAVGLAAVRAAFGPDEVAAIAEGVGEPELRRPLETACDLAARWHDDASLTLRTVAEEAGNAVVGHRSVPAALWAAAVARDVAEAVGLAIGIGGDADTIAAMAGAIAGAAGTVRDIPADWIGRFEDGARGRSYALDLARRLAELPLA